MTDVFFFLLHQDHIGTREEEVEKAFENHTLCFALRCIELNVETRQD